MQQSDLLQRNRRQNPAGLEELHSTLVRNIEHELRTPLAIVQGYAELLHGGDLGQLAEEQQHAVFAIANYANELRTMVDRIGVLLEVEGGTGVSVVLALNDIVAEAVKSRRDAAARAGLHLEAHLAQGKPLVEGDPRQLEQLFDCLLDSVIEFTPPGGDIGVWVYAEAGWTCVAVSGTGIEVLEDKLGHLFEGFYQPEDRKQADSLATYQQETIGLGLTIVKVVTRAHDGRVEIGEQPGQRRRLVVKFPAVSFTPFVLRLKGNK